MVQAAHKFLQDELRASDDLGMGHPEAEALATAAAILMRALALELKAHRIARQASEERRLRRQKP